MTQKELPPYVYRQDSRDPDTIRKFGFQPRQRNDLVSILDHVNGSYSSGPRQGQLTKEDSQWVSTGAYGMLQKLDPTIAQRLVDYFLYKIDTGLALRTGEFHDINDVFDRAGIRRPYPTQREWLKAGGISPAAVVGWLPGSMFAAQYNVTSGAPEEVILRWSPMWASRPGS